MSSSDPERATIATRATTPVPTSTPPSTNTEEPSPTSTPEPSEEPTPIPSLPILDPQSIPAEDVYQALLASTFTEDLPSGTEFRSISAAAYADAPAPGTVGGVQVKLRPQTHQLSYDVFDTTENARSLFQTRARNDRAYGNPVNVLAGIPYPASCTEDFFSVCVVRVHNVVIFGIDGDRPEVAASIAVAGVRHLGTVLKGATEGNETAQSAQEAASRVFEAWFQGNRERVLLFASPQVVDKLFSYDPSDWSDPEFRGCVQAGGEVAGIDCRWLAIDRVLVLTVRDSPATGYFVDDAAVYYDE